MIGQDDDHSEDRMVHCDACGEDMLHWQATDHKCKEIKEIEARSVAPFADLPLTPATVRALKRWARA